MISKKKKDGRIKILFGPSTRKTSNRHCRIYLTLIRAITLDDQNDQQTVTCTVLWLNALLMLSIVFRSNENLNLM